MDRIWQWTWDRYGAWYSWVGGAFAYALLLPVYLALSFTIVASEGYGHRLDPVDYLEAFVVTAVIVGALMYLMIRPGLGKIRVVEQWAAGRQVDQATALDATYSWARAVATRTVWGNAVGAALISTISCAIAGATVSRLVQYGIVGAVLGIGGQLTTVHYLAEAAMRPARLAIAGDTDIGDALPRSRPTFVLWSSMSMLAALFTFAVAGVWLGSLFEQVKEMPVQIIAIASAMTLGVGVPVTVGAAFAPSLRPIRDLADGTERVTAGDYSQRLPVVQDDELGALAASFNRMQAGLAERRRLQAAFGTYVDPSLAARLLEQGDHVFTGERRVVTVMFVDIRDFTPFAEANTAEDTVARLNAVFEIVVPAVVDAGGHVNKFLGDGALAVFGAPNDLADHADAAVSAAVLIQRRVAERFGNELRIGIGINTGVVIAGTIGGAGKLEFTLIGDTVNVAARVEQLTKTTGDAILLTQQCADTLASRPPRLIDRGFHVLKGKSAPVQVFGLYHEADVRVDVTRQGRRKPLP